LGIHECVSLAVAPVTSASRERAANMTDCK
jgi:hypothetical protein